MARLVEVDAPPKRGARLVEVDSGPGVAKNIGYGALQGAADIGATLRAPLDMAQDWVNRLIPNPAIKNEQPTNQKRRADIAEFFQNNANPESLAFQGGRLGAQIAGAAGVPGALAKTAAPVLGRVAPTVAPKLVTALESGGMKIGQKATTLPGKLANAAIRTGAGAVGGAVTAGLVNPEDADVGALYGAAMPAGFKVFGEAGKAVSDKVMRPAAKKLMQSALKPTIKDLKSGKAATAVDTLLKYGINPNQKGVETIRGLIDDINDDVANRIAGSNATIYKSDVMPYLMKPLNNAMSQVSPLTDVKAVARVGQEFLDHPALPNATFPVQAAQNLKQGTYRAIGKKYGQLGSAEVEAQKALARGLKDQISKKVPGVAGLNAEEKRLIDTLNVAERRALMELNKNPVGLSWLANNKAAALAFMADRSAAFKSVAARMINQASKAPDAIDPIGNAFANPLLRTGGLLAIESTP